MRSCIITGSGAGIGRAAAYSLSKTDFYDSYILLGRNREAIQETMEVMKINSSNLNVVWHEIDLSQPERIPIVMEQITKRFQDIVCLLNIAGYTDPQPLFSSSLESFERTYKINVFSTFMLTRECARVMKNGGGKIVNVASTAGMSPRPGWLSYASSKAAVISMSQTLTAELAEYGIKVYCVSPGRFSHNPEDSFRGFYF